ncbi:MAG: hypothetical protein Q4C85_06260 [Actinomyces sp.]|uniref:hypothetical protein n=1 Tax=Actinomyces sp. TaxID=29317 RepID=UPI0026DBAD20|nr:hypothetical protein [Actinomyces sp.]MDO4243354.1 hypothetical protein [Actinomyces sp.]
MLQAVVTQTIAGLACGRPIRGHVMFLGGPLHFLPELRAAFERSLADQVEAFSCPSDAQLYVAIGAALLATGDSVTLDELGTRLATRKSLELGTSRMRPLFADDAERRAFTERHARAAVARAPWPTAPEERQDEAQEGAAAALYERWNAITCEFFEHGGHSATWGGRIGYRRLVREMVREFDALPLSDAPRRPRVGVVGEILVKFQPEANNHVIDLTEAEGCEAAVPGLTAFLLNGLVTAQWNLETYGVGARSVRMKKAAVWLIEQVQAPALAALAACGGKFDVESPIDVMADKASQVVSLGNQAGEGWLLTAEMIELIEHGVPNIVYCQPFACLPHHVVGKGMFREMRRRYPQANIVAVDYEPGASEVNQLNRIKLMVSTALMAHGHTEGSGPGSATFAELLADLGPAPDGTPTSPDGAAAPHEALAALALRGRS